MGSGATGRRLLRVAAVLALAVSVAVTVAAPVQFAAAAGTTAVGLSPADSTVQAGSTTTVDVVVESADGGVGAYNIDVSVVDPATATITGIAPGGNPSESTTETTVAGDGSNAGVAAALADTDDTGTVTVATITLEGQAAGTADLNLTVNALGDETGAPYTVDEVSHGTITVTTPNAPPVADAGADATAIGGDTVELNASGSTDPDGDSLAYTWTQTGGPSVSLSDASTAQPTFTAPDVEAATEVDFSVTVDDGELTDTDAVTVTVQPPPNEPPVADAGSDLTVDEGTAVTLDATGSSDADGSLQSYQWTQTDGPSVTLSDASTAQPTFTAPTLSSADVLTFELAVTDDEGATDTDSVNVTVTPVSPPASGDFAVETEPPTTVGPTSATLRGDLTGLGDDGEATVYFQYWVQGQKTDTLTWWTGSALSSPGAFGDAVSLQPDADYAVQAYAQSDEGEWKAGSVETFSTPATFGVETGPASDVDTEGATLNGSLALGEKTGATPYVRFWVQGQPDETYWYTGEATTQSGDFAFDVTLSPSTTYEWQALAQSDDGTWKAGQVKTLTTPTGQFFGTATVGASNVGTDSATLEGEILNLGDNEEATVYFQYWERGERASTTTWWTGTVRDAPGTFEATVGGLDPGATYEFRALVRSNEGEWKAGATATLTTDEAAGARLPLVDATAPPRIPR
jgi:hypothetical protein